MKLKRLELVGFKSFMDKTMVHFEEGITAVVGPNGCGKSNIVDAIFWVMGDQSAKHLRGKEMEDIIFSGSDRYPSANLAEVHVTFSTEDGGVPPQYAQFSEVTISRKLYRTGESEYFINKAQCRLKDVAEFFMDTGMGAKSYAIIEQGQIGKIVSQKPEERRALIEEAAGITKYKSRKREAQLKLEGTEQNLLRVNDILQELKRQIDSLQRQAKRAEKYKAYKTQIREIELADGSQQYLQTHECLKSLEQTIEALSDRHVEDVATLEKIEALLQKLKLHLIEGEKKLNTAQENLYLEQQKLSDLENQIELKQKEIENWKTHELKDAQDIEMLAERKSKMLSSKNSVEQTLSELRVSFEDSKAQLEVQEKLLDEEIQKQKLLSETLENQKTELMTVLTEETRLKNNVYNFDHHQRSFESQYDKIFETKSKLEKNLAQAKQNHHQVEEKLEALTREFNLLYQAKIQKENDRISMKEKHLELRKNKEQLQEKLHETRSLHQSLVQVTQNYEGFEESVQVLLKEKGQHEVVLKGLVVDLLEIEPGYEIAVEAVLQDKLRYLVVDNREYAVKGINYLTTRQIGMGNFLVTQHASLLPTDVVSDLEWVPLWKKVIIEKTHETWLRQLLKNVYLVSTLAEAFELWQTYAGKCGFVTKEGSYVNASGVVSGGQWKDPKVRFLFQKQDLKRLKETQVTLETAFSHGVEQVSSCEGELQKLDEALNEINQKSHQLEIQKTSISKDVSKSQEDVLRWENELEGLVTEQEQLSHQKQSIHHQVDEDQKQLTILAEQKIRVEALIATTTQEVKEQWISIDQLRNHVQQLKVTYATISEKKVAEERHLTTLVQGLHEITEETGVKENEITTSRDKQEELRKAIEMAKEELSTTLGHVSSAQENLKQRRARYDQDHERHRVLEEGLRKHRQGFQMLETELHEKKLELSKFQMTMDHLASQIADRYQLVLADVCKTYADRMITESERQLLKELKEKTANMPDVNLMAIEEFEVLNKRHQDLNNQREDLIRSMDSLKKTIDKINHISRDRFEETFKIVNENFKKMFPMLFNGGEAKLMLSNPEDLLETGVEILAKPPGKKLQNMNLLSGGEKALTAVSLVFGIFLMKFSPFCLLDEVDAPLDDANVGRFNDMIRELSGRCQFIVITHNKKTMAKSDILYGVTMETPGISNVISVKLDKAIEITKSTRQPIQSVVQSVV